MEKTLKIDCMFLLCDVRVLNSHSSGPNVKKLLARNRRIIESLIDCNGT